MSLIPLQPNDFVNLASLTLILSWYSSIIEYNHHFLINPIIATFQIKQIVQIERYLRLIIYIELFPKPHNLTFSK
jgi:hypothetical protein